MKTVPDSRRRESVESKIPRVPTDMSIEEATPEELDAIRTHLASIEKRLEGLFGPIYSRMPASLQARGQLADLIERHFDHIIRQWQGSICTVFNAPTVNRSDTELTQDLSNALVRFLAHLRDPEDLRTYVHLKRNCEHGMLSRAAPSDFNAIHIALKQAILDHLRTAARSGKEDLRNVAVAAIDERRLMVSWFYIESRERALRASEEKFRNAVNHAPDPIYEIDPATLTVTSANSAAEGLHRKVSGEEKLGLVGRPLIDFVPAEMRDRVVAHFRTVLETGAAQAFDLPLGPFYVDVNSALVTYGGNRFIHTILHDVTHRREMMDELLKAERLATAGTFAAGIAHEVNNPLASISSLVQSLLAGEGDFRRRATLHTILSQITRISSTLKDLVSFARPGPAHRKAVDLNQLISETLRLISYNSRFTGIGIESVLGPSLTPVLADENEIQQVLLNVLLNAADATQRTDGLIRILTETQQARDCEGQTCVRIVVSDNGIGIPQEHLARVFDPFFTTKPAGAGLGLGLSLCQRIILANGGRIRIESDVGQGTSVTISLPAFEAREPAHPPSVR